MSYALCTSDVSYAGDESCCPLPLMNPVSSTEGYCSPVPVMNPVSKINSSNESLKVSYQWTGSDQPVATLEVCEWQLVTAQQHFAHLTNTSSPAVASLSHHQPNPHLNI